jgi:hypothetical protein
MKPEKIKLTDGGEIRFNEDGSVDEIVADCKSVHLEQMDNGHWWLGINRADGNRLLVNLSTRRNAEIRCTVESDDGDVSAGFMKEGDK